jgi:hypothetical protein
MTVEKWNGKNRRAIKREELVEERNRREGNARKRLSGLGGVLTYIS